MENRLSFIDKILKNRLLSHSIFWILFLIAQSQIFLFRGVSFTTSAVLMASIFPSMLMAAYFLTYYQIPHLALKKKYVQFVLSLILSTYLFTVIARLLTVFIAEPYLDMEEIPSTDFVWIVMGSINRLTRSYLLSVYLGAVIMAIIKLIKLRSEEKAKIERLEKEKTTTELNFLKAQIHPHFLLNTLNNIYALTIKKSDKAPETVLKLSEMLTYVLYKCNEKYVALKDEVKLIENYLALERLRYDDQLKLKFTKDLSQASNLQIAPVILLSIVENAFKHGASSDIANPEIFIRLKVHESQLHFEVQNTKSEVKQDDPNNFTKGIGSENVKKQLELLYPNRHSFVVTEEKRLYLVTLTLDLNP